MATTILLSLNFKCKVSPENFPQGLESLGFLGLILYTVCLAVLLGLLCVWHEADMSANARR